MDSARLGVLTFVAAHQFVLAEQAALLLGVSEPNATEWLEELLEQRLVARFRLSARWPAAYRITQQGADQVGSASPLRPADLTRYGYAVTDPGL
jgi:hypothetical protein